MKLDHRSTLFALASLAGLLLTAPGNAQVTTGLKLWLRADAGVTLDGTNHVSAWADQSGLARHGSQSNTSARPLFVSNALNGNPVLRFDGGNDFFSLAGQVLTTQQFTIMAVVNDTRGNGDTSFREIFSNWDFSNHITSVFFGTTDNDGNNNPVRARLTDQVGGATDPGNTQVGVGSIVNPATHFIFTGIASASDTQVYQNTNLLASKGGPLSALNLTTGYVIGRQGALNSEYWRGDMAEILVYDHALSAAEFSQNIAYLQSKYYGVSAVYHVSTSGNDANSGLSWNQAKRTVGAGVSTAWSGDQVLVAGGTYGNTHVGLRPGVQLLGGYAGTGPNPDARDTQVYETILDGNGFGAVVYVAPAQANRPPSKVDGFTITHGHFGFYLDNANVTVSNNHIVANSGDYGAGINGPGGAPQITGNLIENNKGTGNGGGIHLVNSSPYIAGNIIRNNTVDGFGAAIAMGSCHFVIENNQILNNTANYCGGIGLSTGTGTIHNNTITGNKSNIQQGGGIDSSATPIIITNNTIKNNRSPWTGGILLAYAPLEITVTGNTISDNNGDAAGGFACFRSNGTLANNKIENNVCAGGAAGVWVADLSNLDISDNTIKNNKANNGNGGGLWLVDSTLTLHRNQISDNTCNGYGGGLFSNNNTLDLQFNHILRNTAKYNGGGAEILGTRSTMVANNLFDGNEGQYNCALTFAYGSSFKAYNNTFVNTKTHNGGTTLGLYQASATLANNILANNPAGGIYSNPGGVAVADTLCYNNLSFGNGWDFGGQVQVFNALYVDPQFANAAGGDYTLKPTSPAIDAGNNASVAPENLDLAGQTRVFDGYVDLGAYEIQTPLLDVSASVQVTRGGFRRNATTGRYTQTVTLTNTGGTTISGPVSLVLDALSSNATLFNATGTTALRAPLGSPYLDLSASSLAPGSAVTLTLEFTNPTNARISYNTRVLAGPGKR